METDVKRIARYVLARVLAAVSVALILMLLRACPAQAALTPNDWRMSDLHPAGTGYPTGGKQPLKVGVPRHIFGLTQFGASPTEVYSVVRDEWMPFGSTGGGNLMGSTQVGYRLHDESFRMPDLQVSAEQTAVCFYMASALVYYQRGDDPDRPLERWAMAGPQNSFSYLKFVAVPTWTFGLTMIGNQVLPAGLQYYDFQETGERGVRCEGTPIFEHGGGWIWAAHYDEDSGETRYKLWTGSTGGTGGSVLESATVTGYMSMDEAVANGKICYPTTLQRVVGDEKDGVQFPKRDQDLDQLAYIHVDGLWCSQFTTDTVTVETILNEWDGEAANANSPDIRQDIIDGSTEGTMPPSGIGGLPGESRDTTLGLDPFDWADVFDPIVESVRDFFWPLTALDQMGSAE